MDTKLADTIRHILTFSGGLLVAFGITDIDTANALTSNIATLAGAAVSLAGLAHSLWSKRSG